MKQLFELYHYALKEAHLYLLWYMYTMIHIS